MQSVSPGLSATQRQNLQKFFINTSVIPFEFNNGLCCFFCGKHIIQYDDLKKHTKSHDSSTIEKFFQELTPVMINLDVSEVNCDICELTFEEFGSLIDHVKSSHDLTDLTTYVDIRKFSLIDIRCVECDKRFINYSVLQRHIHEMHEVLAPSNNVIYSTANYEIRKKLKTKANKHSLNNKKKYSLDCPKCSKILTSKLGYQLHLTKCGLKKEPNVVSVRNTTPLKVRQNISSIISMSTAIPFKFFKNHFRCFYCSKDFADFEVLKDHTVTDHSDFDYESKVMKKIKGKEVTVKIDILNLTCKLCLENLVDLSDLINHLTSNHGAIYDTSIECLQPFRILKDDIRCPLCPDAVFRYFKKLLEHMNEIHSDNNIVCAHCGLTFRGHPNYRAHMSRYHRTRACKCPDCNMEFWNLEKLARHRANVHGTKKFNCPQCIEKFVTNYMMRRHQIVVHGFGHKCQYCNKLFTRNSHMKNHVRRLHLKEKNVECNVCKEKFFDRALLNVHMVKHIGERNYHCDVCDFNGPPKKLSSNTLRRRNLMILFNNTTIIPFKCRGKCRCFYCGEEIPIYDELRKHTEAHGPCSENDRSIKLIKTDDAEVKIDVSDLTCVLCNETFNNLDEIVAHLMNKHKLPYDKNVKLLVMTYRLIDLQCLLCKQKFLQVSELVIHVNLKHPSQSLDCNVCHQTFIRKGYLDAHMRLKHKKDHKCLKCPNKFASHAELQEHKSKAHVAVCNICFTRFSTQKKRLMHMKTEHSGDKLKCGFCLKSMNTQLGFLRHAAKCTDKRIDESNTEILFNEDVDKKPAVIQIRKNIACLINMSTAIPFKYFMSRFRCFYCPKNFTNCLDLREHTVNQHPVCHTNFKCMRLRNRHEGCVKIDISVLSCKVCYENYSNLETLIEHLIQEHRAQYDKTVDSNIQPYKLIKDNYPCPICTEVYTHFSTLLKHVGQTHTDNKNICVHCGKSFRNLPNLRVHISNHHKTSGSFKCETCCLEFPSNKYLQTHMGRAHGVCNKPVKKCSANKLRRTNLQTLFNNTSIIPFKWRGKYICFYCGEGLKEHDELKRHTKKHGICLDGDHALRLVKAADVEVKIDVSEIICNLCYEELPTFDNIIDHLMIKHNLPYDRDVKLKIAPYKLSDLTCLSCDQKFNYLSKLINHVNVDHPNDCLVCIECKQKFNKKRDLDAHFRTKHRNQHLCSKCYLTFSTNSELLSHKSNAHPFLCNICFKPFLTLQKRLQHIETSHLDAILKCGFCSKSSSSKGFLEHAAICNVNVKNEIIVPDDDNKPSVKQIRVNIACILNMSTAVPFKYFMSRFRCFYCPKDFTECDDLKQHTIIEHPLCDTKLKSMKLRNRRDGGIKVDTSSLSCKICFESLDDLNTLIDHLICKHKINYDRSTTVNLQSYKLAKENFPCPFCVEVFRYFSTLLNHVGKRHTDNKNICVHCGLAFRNLPNLRAHNARHHKVANFKCTLCDLQFTSNNYLQTHLGRVHKNKIVDCQECVEKFTSVYEMQRHKIDAHSTGHKCTYCQKLFTRNSFMVNHIRRTHLKEKNVQCSICHDKFFDSQRLKGHMVKHYGERNFHCDLCGKRFLWKKNLKGHMASHIKNTQYHKNLGG
ncbi:jg14217 [Pararge aegeria aegeria]|uniref:Jg14217 protein n=1 Tax=Pararge aegeria aegeria TaxID=348720 RepID=A0A8S4RFX0_9NEOP|nr:jg14217 [Pararge aegeria aegeria]